MLVEFEYFNGRITVWASKIAALVETPKGTEIYVDGSDDPFAVLESYNEVRRRLGEQSNRVVRFQSHDSVPLNFDPCLCTSNAAPEVEKKQKQPQLSFKHLYAYLHHLSWKCGYYDQCSCGLDDLTDKDSLPRIARRYEID